MELAVHQNKIISTFDRLASREKERSSDAGEDREEIGSLLELTGLNKRAVAFVRGLHKAEPDKRADVLRSLKPLLDMMEAHWDGQKTPDFFEDAAEPAGDDVDDEEDDAPDDDEADDDLDAQLADAAE